MPKSNEKSANELAGLLENHAELLHQIEAEDESLRDPDPAVMTALRKDAYHELFVDTPSKELLWQSERCLDELLEEDQIHPWVRDAIFIDIIEAYSVIQPDEGYRLIKKMPTVPAKAEAIAKFALHTDSSLFKMARHELRYRDGNDFYGDDLINNYEIVGMLGQDAESCRLAHDVALKDYLRYEKHFELGEQRGMHVHSRRTVLSSLLWKKNIYIDTLVSLVALGYEPAIDVAKSRILESKVDPGDSAIVRNYQIAVIEFVEHQLAVEQMIGLSDPAPIERIKDKLNLEKTWSALVESRLTDVVSVLKNEFQLPHPRMAFDQVYKLAHYKDGLNDIQNTLQNFAVILENGGKVSELIAQPGESVWKWDWRSINAACTFRAVRNKVFELTDVQT